MRTSIVVIVLTALVGFNPANAQSKSNDTTARYFIIQASISNLQEIAIGRLAAERTGSPEVKAFAAKMATDHSQAEAQLMQLVRIKGIQIPKEATDPPVEDMMLKNTPAKDFDDIYVHMMVSGHRETVGLFESYSFVGKDPEVKAFARQMLPVLKEHLAAIIDIDNSINGKMAK